MQWRSRHTINRRHKEQAANMRAKLKELLSKTEEKIRSYLRGCFALQSKRYLGITVHFIETKNILRHFVQAFLRFTRLHTGKMVLELTIEVIEYFCMREKVHYDGTDNGSNMIPVFDEWMAEFMDPVFDSNDAGRFGLRVHRSAVVFFCIRS